MSKRPSVEFTNLQVVSKAEAESFISKDKLVEKHMRKRSKYINRDGSTTHFIECTFTDCAKQHKVVLPMSPEEKATILESNNAHDHGTGFFAGSGIGEAERKFVEEALQLGIKKPKQISGFLASHGCNLSSSQVLTYYKTHTHMHIRYIYICTLLLHYTIYLLIIYYK